MLEKFLSEETIEVPGALTRYGDFCAAFLHWLPEAERPAWPKRAVGRELDAIGEVRGTTGGGLAVGNRVLRRHAITYAVVDGFLRKVPLCG